MQTYPLIIVSGPAGSGKDTVAGFLATLNNGVVIAQADPMKRFVRDLFGFSEDQLWGPSAARSTPGHLSFEQIDHNFDTCAIPFVDSLPILDKPSAKVALRMWYMQLIKSGVELTPRRVLQLLGTEFGRAVNPDVWSNYAQNTAHYILAGGMGYDKTKGLVAPAPLVKTSDLVIISDGRFRNEILNVRRVGGMALRIKNPTVDTSKVLAGGVQGHASEAEMATIPDSWFNYVIHNDHYGLDALFTQIQKFSKDVITPSTSYPRVSEY